MNMDNIEGYIMILTATGLFALLTVAVAATHSETKKIRKLIEKYINKS